MGQNFQAMVERRNARWTKVISSGSGRRWVDDGIVLGYCVSREVTHGRHGWHPHIHALIFFEPGVKAHTMARYWMWLCERWVKLCKRDGDHAVDEAQHWTLATSGEAAGSYVTKFGAEWEITHSHLKRATGESRSPFQLLKDYVDNGDEEAGRLFKQFAEAMKGKRQLTWPGKVDHKYGIRDAEDDEALHEQEETAPILAFIEADTYRRIEAKKLQSAIEVAIDCSGFDGLQALLHIHRLGNLWPPEKATRWRPTGGFCARRQHQQEKSTC
jgi:hypothetical protein